MAELEYLSVFLLYTDMYVHEGNISDWGNTCREHKGVFALFSTRPRLV